MHLRAVGLVSLCPSGDLECYDAYVSLCEAERETFCAHVVLSQLFFLVLDTPCHVRHGEKI